MRYMQVRSLLIVCVLVVCVHGATVATGATQTGMDTPSTQKTPSRLWSRASNSARTFGTWIKSKYAQVRGSKRVEQTETISDGDRLGKQMDLSAKKMVIAMSTPRSVPPYKEWLGGEKSESFTWRGFVETNLNNCVDSEVRIKSIDFRALYKQARRHDPNVDLSQPSIICYPATYSNSDISRLGRCMTDWGHPRRVKNWHKGTWSHQGEFVTYNPPLVIPIQSPYGRNSVQCDIRFGWSPRIAASFRILPFYMTQGPEGDEDYYQSFSSLVSPYFGVSDDWKKNFPSFVQNAKGPAVHSLRYNSCRHRGGEKHCYVTAQFRCKKTVELPHYFDPHRKLPESREKMALNRKLSAYYTWAVEENKRQKQASDSTAQTVLNRRLYPHLGQPKQWRVPSGKRCPNILSHRAVYSLSDRENRKEGLDKLWAAGIDGIEIDVYLEGRDPKLGHRVTVTHDDDFGRLMGLDSIKITDFTSPVQLDGLKKATGCIWQFDNLVDYLSKAKAFGLLVNIELKPGNPMEDPWDGYAEQLGESVGNIVRLLEYEHNTVVSSFDVKKLSKVNAGVVKGGTMIGIVRQTYKSVMSQAKSMIDDFFNNDIAYTGHAYHYSLITKDIVDREHAAGRTVGVFTIFDRYDPKAHSVDLIDNLIEWGVDWMETDNPQILHRFMKMSNCGQGTE